MVDHKLLGTREFFVVHHSDCGVKFFSDDVIRGLLASSLETAELTPQGFRDVGRGPGSRAGEYIDWLTVKDRAQAVMDDVERIRNHPLVPRSIPIYGFVYDVHSGKLTEVKRAQFAGRAAEPSGVSKPIIHDRKAARAMVARDLNRGSTGFASSAACFGTVLERRAALLRRVERRRIEYEPL